MERFGELAIAAEDPNDDSRRCEPGGLSVVELRDENPFKVGLAGREVFVRDGLVVVDFDSPDAASVRRNSTQRRENDCSG